MRSLPITVATLSLGISACFSQVVGPLDPARSATELCPAPDISEGAPWIYGDGEFEAWQLQRLREKSGKVCRHVGYPGRYYSPSASIRFRLRVGKLPEYLSFKSHGSGEVLVDKENLGGFAAGDDVHRVELEPALHGRSGLLEVRMDSTKDEPLALLIETGPCSTALNYWESSVNGQQWAPAKSIPRTRSGQPPHLAELPTVGLEPVQQEDGLYDFGRTVLATVVFRAEGRPRLYVGESQEEASYDNTDELEQRTDLDRGADGAWRSRHQLAFRYVRIEGAEPAELKAEAAFRPVQYHGSFKCSDERVNRIWEHATYTMRVCMNHLMLDGLKRDRLPWIGDQAVNLLVNAYVFQDAEIARQSFTALGRNGIEKSDINGIADYTLWWIIANDWFQLYFDDPAYLRREWPRLKEAVELLQTRCNADGYLVPRRGSWLFIDWGVKSPKSEINVPLQMIWCLALKSGAALAERRGDDASANAWRDQAATLAETLDQQAWNREAGGYPLTIEKPEVLSRHANLLAVLSGVAGEEQQAAIKGHLLGRELPPVITPYMGSLELMALSRLSAADAILPRIESFWGKQLELGASTFWEKYDTAKPGNYYSMYRRPFANSLCHAWGSGLAAVLPAEILGLRPLADGWKRFAVDPRPGPLTSINATIPTPHGNIVARLAGDSLHLTIPQGTIAVHEGEDHTGRATLKVERAQPPGPKEP